jgi:sigma-B regulation protein RsbU (phosphoserine phosphatase)
MRNEPTHVLLIEDNQGDADLVRLRLVECTSDLIVSHADRLSTGLAVLAMESPAVILLDLNLPDSRGADTFREVLGIAPRVPVVVLSGRDDEELAITAIHHGAQDYLVKGQFNGPQLGRAMRYAVERKALQTALDLNRNKQLQIGDQFLSHISHELNTPLTCAQQSVMILLDGRAGPVAADQRDHLETILRSVNQLRDVIGDLIQTSSADFDNEPNGIVAGIRAMDSIHSADIRHWREGTERSREDTAHTYKRPSARSCSSQSQRDEALEHPSCS